MKFYTEQSVWDAALDRIKFLYQEFPNVIVSFSGGKDSTVILELALIVAKELNRLPVKVVFLDQEAEYQTVIDYIRERLKDPDIEPWWFQIPVKLFNSTSSDTDWLYCWEEGKDDEWMRPKEPGAIKVNRYGTEKFKQLFERISFTEWGNQKTAWLAGVRCEESPAREVGLTTAATYQHITWGRRLCEKRQHFNFYPIYDWSYTDIWKAIHSNGWPYCRIYDEQYKYGVGIWNMRVSNLHHETGFAKLYYLQEIEKETWEKLCKRLPGISTVGSLKDDAYMAPKKLPFMFKSWREYRDYLLEYICLDDSQKKKFIDKFKRMDIKYNLFPDQDKMMRICIKAILSNDYHMTQIDNFFANQDCAGWRRWMDGKRHEQDARNPYIKMHLAKGMGPVPLPRTRKQTQSA